MRCHVLCCVIVMSGLLKLHTLSLAVGVEIVRRVDRVSQLRAETCIFAQFILSRSFCSCIQYCHWHAFSFTPHSLFHFFTCVELVCYCVKLESLCDKCFVVTLIMLHLLRGIPHRAHMVFAALSPDVLIYLLFTCVMFLF